MLRRERRQPVQKKTKNYRPRAPSRGRRCRHSGAARARRRGGPPSTRSPRAELGAHEELPRRPWTRPARSSPVDHGAARAELAERPWRPLARSSLRPRRPPTAASCVDPRRARASHTGHLLHGPCSSGPHSGAGLTKARRRGALVFPAPSARFDSSQRFFREIPRRSCFYVVYVQLREKQLPELLLELYQTHPFLSFVLRRIGSNVHRPHLSSTHALPEDPEAEASNPHTLPESSGPNRGGGVGLNFQLVSPLLSGRLL